MSRATACFVVDVSDHFTLRLRPGTTQRLERRARAAGTRPRTLALAMWRRAFATTAATPLVDAIEQLMLDCPDGLRDSERWL